MFHPITTPVAFTTIEQAGKFFLLSVGRPKTDHEIDGSTPFKGNVQEKETTIYFLFLFSEYCQSILRHTAEYSQNKSTENALS